MCEQNDARKSDGRRVDEWQCRVREIGRCQKDCRRPSATGHAHERRRECPADEVLHEEGERVPRICHREDHAADRLAQASSKESTQAVIKPGPGRHQGHATWYGAEPSIRTRWTRLGVTIFSPEKWAMRITVILAAAVLAIPEVAFAGVKGEPIRLVVDAPSGCVTESELVAEVERLGMHVPIADEGERARRFDVTIACDGDHFVARLAVRDLVGRETVRSVTNDTCVDAGRAASLLVSLALWPRSRGWCLRPRFPHGSRRSEPASESWEWGPPSSPRRRPLRLLARPRSSTRRRERERWLRRPS